MFSSLQPIIPISVTLAFMKNGYIILNTIQPPLYSLAIPSANAKWEEECSQFFSISSQSHLHKNLQKNWIHYLNYPSSLNLSLTLLSSQEQWQAEKWNVLNSFAYHPNLTYTRIHENWIHFWHTENDGLTLLGPMKETIGLYNNFVTQQGNDVKETRLWRYATRESGNTILNFSHSDDRTGSVLFNILGFFLCQARWKYWAAILVRKQLQLWIMMTILLLLLSLSWMN